MRPYDPFADAVVEGSDDDLAVDFVSDEEDEVSITSDIDNYDDIDDNDVNDDNDDEVTSSSCDYASFAPVTNTVVFVSQFVESEQSVRTSHLATDEW